MKTQLLSSIAGLAMVAGGLTGLGTSVAAADGAIPIPPPPPLEVFTPPNCDVVEDKNGNSTLDCDIPPECEFVNYYLGGAQITVIECDLPPGCDLVSGDFFGTKYWYVECAEDACGGGCNPFVPRDIGMTTPPNTGRAIGSR